MEDLKFKTLSVAHSKAIQKRLFKLGCKWAGSLDQEIGNAEGLCIYVYDNRMYHNFSKDPFIDYSGKSATLDDLYNESVINPKNEDANKTKIDSLTVEVERLSKLVHKIETDLAK